jgi:hypothetical protein
MLMPNWTLSPTFKAYTSAWASNLADKRLFQSQRDFPLNRDTIQKLTASDRMLALLKELGSHGIKTDTTVNTVGWYVPGNRGIILSVKGISPSVITSDAHRGYSYNLMNKTAAPRTKGLLHNAMAPTFPMDWQALTEDQRATLTKWVDHAVQEVRLAHITKQTVSEFLDKTETNTVGHLMVRWPALVSVIEDERWKMRCGDAPKNLRRYHWSCNPYAEAWYTKNKRAMKLAEVCLLSAMMLPKAEVSGITARVVHWEVKPGETF